jgi:hypothetical protein
MNQAIEKLWQRALLRTFLKGVAGLITNKTRLQFSLKPGFRKK